MPSSGELNGTTCLISKGAVPAELIGQGEATITYGGTPIDISNKSNGDWICLLDGELSAQQVTIATTLVYNDDATFEAVKAEAFTGTQDDYTFDFGSSAESLTGKFVPTGMSDAVPHGDKVMTTVTFNSSGTVARTPQTIVP